MAKSLAEIRALAVTPRPTAGQGLALGPDGKIPGSALPSYTTYTPTWSSDGTAPVIGNAAVTARYAQVGKLVHAYGKIVFGSTSTFGTGNYFFALPVAASANALSALLGGTVALIDSSAAAFGTAICQLSSATVFDIKLGATYLGSQNLVAASFPWAWAVSDTVNWNIAYEAA